MIRLTRPTKVTRICALILSFGVFAGATAANQPLSEVTVVTEGLITAAIAYEIGDKCDSVDARVTTGINFLWGLKAQASDLGYSDDEIRAYIDDDVEKDRLEAIARDRLRDMGAVEGEWDTYCAVGRAEMAAGTQIGKLLR